MTEDKQTEHQEPTKAEMLRALGKAVGKGDLSSHEAQRIRFNMGYPQSVFTKKRTTKEKSSKIKKLQKAAKKKQRK